MNRRRFLAKVVAVAGGVVAVKALEQTLSAMGQPKHCMGHDALVCGSCAFNNKHTYCAICGKRRCTNLDSYERARVCNVCDDKGNKCAYCGKFVGESTMKARICNHCADSERKRWNCYKCGRSTGPELG